MQRLSRYFSLRAWLSVGLLAAAPLAGAYGLQAVFGYNLDGQPVTSLASPHTSVVVLFFTATDCPISNRYLPAMQRLVKKYAAQHVVFWYVYPNAGETAAGVRRHELDYGVESYGVESYGVEHAVEHHVLLDPHHRLVDLAGASVTPEAAVLIRHGSGAEALRAVYRGRIDNRYIQIGLQRPKATQYDLDRAIVDVLQHRPVHPPDGPPVGCGIIGQP